MLKIHLFRWSLFIKFWKLQKAFKFSEKLPYTLLHYKVEINKNFRKKQKKNSNWIPTQKYWTYWTNVRVPFLIGLCFISYQL